MLLCPYQVQDSASQLADRASQGYQDVAAGKPIGSTTEEGYYDYAGAKEAVSTRLTERFFPRCGRVTSYAGELIT